MGVKGSALTSSKFNHASTSSFHLPSCSRSRHSDKNDIPGARSRSITSSIIGRSVHLRFGYPVKLRSSKYYVPDLTESELRFREESFVNDSIHAAHQSYRSPSIPPYEPLNDSSLKKFLQSPVVLDVVRKTLNINLDERSIETKKQSKIVIK